MTKGVDLMPDIGAVFWLILLIIFVVAEALTTTLVSIWFAAGALAALILSVFNLSIYIQIGAFVVVSLILLLSTRSFAKKFLDPQITKTNFDRIVGESGLVEEDINNLEETGAVKIKGITWTARSCDESIIPKGSIVEIKKIEGVKVFVSLKNN